MRLGPVRAAVCRDAQVLQTYVQLKPVFLGILLCRFGLPLQAVSFGLLRCGKADIRVTLHNVDLARKEWNTTCC